MRKRWLYLIGLFLLPACSRASPAISTARPAQLETPNPAPAIILPNPSPTKTPIDAFAPAIQPTASPSVSSSTTPGAQATPTTCAAFGDARVLSPDKRTLAYIAEGSPPVLVLRNTASNAERRLPLPASDPDTQAGSIAWSPDSAALVLTTAIHPCDANHWLYSVIRVDIAPLTQKTLISNRPRYLRTVRWRTLTLIDLEDGPGNFVRMDAMTGGSPTK